LYSPKKIISFKIGARDYRTKALMSGYFDLAHFFTFSGNPNGLSSDYGIRARKNE